MFVHNVDNLGKHVELYFELIDTKKMNNSDIEQPVLSTVRCDERPFSQSQPPYVWNYMSC